MSFLEPNEDWVQLNEVYFKISFTTTMKFI